MSRRPAGNAPVVERSAEVAGVRTHWREARPTTATRVLYVHGVPTGSWDWLPFLERIGGVAPDLPGFAGSAKPAGFDYSIPGYAAWLEAFTDAVGLDRFALVVHDWGAVGLALAQRFPARIERLVILTCAPFLPGYRWHWVARIWRTPALGELFMATATKRLCRQLSRQANVTPGPLPDAFLDEFWRGFDRRTRRAILRLYRSASPETLARAGERLADLSCPALVLWSAQDPYIPAEFGPRYAKALGGDVRLEMLEGAGHWPWLDRPDVIETAAEFLT